jgi:hypothetical protein
MQRAIASRTVHHTSKPPRREPLHTRRGLLVRQSAAEIEQQSREIDLDGTHVTADAA